MDRIIVAFEGEKQRGIVVEALESAGLPVKRACASRAEAVRAVGEMGGGIVVCGHKFADSTADELAYDVGESALVLVIARGDHLDLCENPRLFKLSAPFTRGELISSVRMLKQLEDMRLPLRSEDEKRLVDRAKQHLMKTRGMTEPEAHRALQRASMRTGERMAVAAARLLEGNCVR